MTQETKTNIKQVVAILVGLVLAYFVFTTLFAFNTVVGWIVFSIALVIFGLFCFGINLFAKKEVIVEDTNSQNQPTIIPKDEDYSLNSGQDRI